MAESDKRINFFIVLYSGLRRRFLVYFRPRYVILSLLKRQGKCKMCSCCCLLNKHWCSDFKENKCQIYQRQPFFCKIFPIDEKDKKMSGVNKECGYYWDSDNPAD